VDFKLGYSPERINPGDREHRLETITKVVAGEDEETLERLAAVYGQIVEAGIHRAPSLEVAEAAIRSVREKKVVPIERIW
jgi:UDP-N-acetyl-D-galactosamine dehydrogenase